MSHRHFIIHKPFGYLSQFVCELKKKKLLGEFFDFPENTTLDKAIDEILKRNKLEKGNDETLGKTLQEVESKAVIIEHAALTIIKKIIPENKLVEFLEKHLEASNETARKIVKDINQTIIPFAKTTNSQGDEETSAVETEETKKEAFREAKEELLRKIGAKNSNDNNDKNKCLLNSKSCLEVRVRYVFLFLNQCSSKTNIRKIDQEGNNC